MEVVVAGVQEISEASAQVTGGHGWPEACRESRPRGKLGRGHTGECRFNCSRDVQRDRAKGQEWDWKYSQFLWKWEGEGGAGIPGHGIGGVAGLVRATGTAGSAAPGMGH